MARCLADLPETFRILCDRRIRGTRANIDHIAIGPTGVWVIDAKRYVGKRPALRVEGGIIRPRAESLRIGGRDGTKLVEGLQSQVEQLTAALGDAVPLVTGMLRLLEVDWPLIGGSFSVDGVHVVWPRLLIQRLMARRRSSSTSRSSTPNLPAPFPAHRAATRLEPAH